MSTPDGLIARGGHQLPARPANQPQPTVPPQPATAPVPSTPPPQPPQAPAPQPAAPPPLPAPIPQPAPQIAPTAPAAQPEPSFDIPMMQESPQPDYIVSPRPRPKKRRKLLFIGLPILILLLVGGGLAARQLFSSKPKPVAKSATPPPPPAPPAPPPVDTAKLKSEWIDYSILFRAGTATSQYPQVDQQSYAKIIDFANRWPTAKLHVIGWVPKGASNSARSVADKRTTQVKAALVAGGIADARISVGAQEIQPSADSSSSELRNYANSADIVLDMP